MFDGSLKVTSVTFFVADFNLLSSEFDSFTFTLLHWVILYKYYIKARLHLLKTFTILLQFLVKNQKFILLPQEWKNIIAVFPARSIFFWKINQLNCFRISIKCMLSTQIYCYHLIMPLQNRYNLIDNHLCNHLLDQ